jgi:hypothetical protein
MADLYELLDNEDVDGFTAALQDKKDDINKVLFMLNPAFLLSFQRRCPFSLHQTLLMYALSHERDKFVPAILKLKPDVTIALADGRQALHLAAQFGRDAQIPVLIKAGASATAADLVPLHFIKAGFLSTMPHPPIRKSALMCF